MRTHHRPLALTTTIVMAASLMPGPAPARAVAQVVEQTIRVVDPSGVQVPLPFGPGAQRQFKTGTGRIRGRVLSSDGGGPVRRAQVRITGQDIAPKAAITDNEGRFEFRDLPAGRFTLQASKTGFVTVQYGQTRPFEQGKTIELADKQALDNADIGMPRGGVISGRIVDEFGDAVPDASVTAMRQTWSNGRRRLMPSSGRIAQTNDLGQFRIFGLPPGDYVISATARSTSNPLLDMVDVGAVGGVFTTSVSGAGVAEPRSGYASTYYPGTPNVAEAQKIALGPSQELSGADFALLPVRLAKVTGLVIGSDGKPAEGAMVMLVPAQRESAGLSGLTTSRTGGDGAFTLNSVPPGEYMLQARSTQTITTTSGDSVMVFRAAALGGGGDAEFGSTPMTIVGDDIANLVLVTAKGATASGRVIFDGPAPASMSGIRLTSVAIDPETAGPVGGGPATVKEDGTFEMKGLAGPRLIRVAGAPQGWVLRSVKLNGADISDTGADFKPGESVSGLEIELTQRVSTVSGTVTDADGSMLKDYTVVLFAESPELWRLPATRWVHGARPDQEGRFRVQNLPPGAYLAVALEYVPQGEWGDPDLLDRLRPKGKRFTLSDGASQTLDLRLSK